MTIFLGTGLQDEQDGKDFFSEDGARRGAAEFAEGSSILDALPRVSPLPGSTPAAVVANGVYNADTNEADLTWTENPASHIESYQVRAVAGPE